MYFIPKSIEVSLRGIGEYRKSYENFSTSSTANTSSGTGHSNPHYESRKHSNSQNYAMTTPYKEGAIIYYAVKNDVIDWVEADILGGDINTMEYGGVLKQGNTAVYTAQHTVTQADIDAGNLLYNDVTVTASLFVHNESDPDEEPLEVIITDSIDSPVETNLNSTSELEVTKQADIDDKNRDGFTNSGDKVTYTIDITNTGTQTITGLEIEDTLSDLDGNLISNPDLSQLTINTNYVYHTDDLYNNLRRSSGSNSNNVGLQYSTEPPNNISIYVDPENNHNEKGVGIISTGDSPGSFWGNSIDGSNPIGVQLERFDENYNSNSEDHIFFNSSYSGVLNNGGYKLEPNTAYTLSVYARKNDNFEDSNFNLFVYDGLAGLNHVQTNSIIENSFKSEDFLVSSEWKRYSFTFTTGEVNYPNHNNNLNGTTGNSQIAHPRFGVILPKGVNDPTRGRISIWGLQLEKSYKPTMYVLNDGTDKYDDPKEQINIFKQNKYTFKWGSFSENYSDSITYPKVSLGLRSMRNFSSQFLARKVTDKSPAIIEYPGIIDSLDGGPSKESLKAQDWVLNNFVNNNHKTDNDNYISHNMNSDDYWYSRGYNSNGYVGYEIESQYYQSNDNYNWLYNNNYYDQYIGEYNGTKYWWSYSYTSPYFAHAYNKLVDLDSQTHSNATPNPKIFFTQYQTQDEYEFIANQINNGSYMWIGLVKERDTSDNLIAHRWLGPQDKPILLGHYNGHSYFFIRQLKHDLCK